MRIFAVKPFIVCFAFYFIYLYCIYFFNTAMHVLVLLVNGNNVFFNFFFILLAAFAAPAPAAGGGRPPRRKFWLPNQDS